MPRAPREETTGGIYHVGTRGSSRQPIYLDEEDRWVFLWRFGRVAARERWTCLTYCLMANHFHLVLELGDRGLSGGMQQLLSGYSRATNRKYGRSDHLFKQHFFSERVKRESQFLEVCRYVVCNPVRAGLVETPDEWQWSSYRATVGLAFAPAFLAVGRLLELFGDEPAQARRRYCEFVAAAGREAVSDTVMEA